ncbi:hypothetical protein [Pseudobutyrivibrio sp. MD2005]|uniref:hypothetical protein n=1 Tax=Pseudobutyrivibrio sp. MD2005 TaxID=1410616 RepID=UPI000480D4B6|nr:hypothetical protein [Pseudobutyrivibrio sp. MD2005]
MGDKSIFREKNVKKASEVELLDGYIRVNGYASWVMVLGGGLLIAVFLLWAFIGRIDLNIDGAASSDNGRLTCYFNAEDVERMNVGMQVVIEDKEYTIEEIGNSLYYQDQVPNDIRYLNKGCEWYRVIYAESDLEDGTYRASVLTESIRPISFLAGGK